MPSEKPGQSTSRRGKRAASTAKPPQKSDALPSPAPSPTRGAKPNSKPPAKGKGAPENAPALTQPGRQGKAKPDAQAQPQAGRARKGAPAPAEKPSQRRAEPAKEARKQRPERGHARHERVRAPEEDLPTRVLKLIREVSPRPLDKVDITKALGLKPDARNQVREALRAFESDGTIVHASGGRYTLPRDQGLLEGTYLAHEGGFGFVIIGGEVGADHPDVFIPERHSANALHRDKVLVRLRKPRGQDDRRGRHKPQKGDKTRGRTHEPLPGEKLEGEIARIVSRANPTLVGTVQRDPRSRKVLMAPDETRITKLVHLLAPPGAALPPVQELEGKKVMVRLLEWEGPWDDLEGELVEIIGDASDPEVALQSLIRKYRLPLEFPPEVLEEANAISDKLPEKECKRRMDLRKDFIFTIDPETARDFDDAIHIRRTKDDGYELGIHIADVSYYVYPGTALDREARLRGNSTYLVDRVIPMIPERLSNGICSLVPNEDRATRSVLLRADKKGRITHANFAETVINSKVRLAYPQALALLENPDGSEISDAVNLAWEFADKARKLRFSKGALDLDFPEVKVILDDAGHPIELRREENDISHQLIEEFMLLANEAVAKVTRERSLASLYRVHEEPDVDKLAEFRLVLHSYGFPAGDLTQRKELQKFLAALRGHTEEGAMKVALLKSLKRAAYDTQPAGHYGLAKEDYTHFTSPIRRYADLVVHRVLLRTLEKKPSKRQANLDKGQLGRIAEHISETERIATEAERESLKLKQLEYLKDVIGKAPKGTIPRFKAVVTDIRSFGAFVEMPDMLISGLLRQQDLREFGFNYDSMRGGYVRRAGDLLLKIGSEITVEVMEIDLLRKQVNFKLIIEGDEAATGKPKKPAKARREEKRGRGRR